MRSPIELARGRASLRTKRRIAQQRLRVRGLTSSIRPLPRLLIIGTQRGGTSSLYRYLGAHPDVERSIRKETEYLTRSYGCGEAWYRSHFTLRRDRLSFEATPDYLLHPQAPARAAALLPNAKVIALLRDPVARAVSHHGHMTRLGYEDLPLCDALAAEPDRLDGALDALVRGDDVADVRPLLRFSYAARGRYGEQLERWLEHTDRERLLVLRSEDLYADPAAVLHEVEDFLELRRWLPPSFPNHSLAGGRSARSPADDRALDDLHASLADDGVLLRSLLGDRWRWD